MDYIKSKNTYFATPKDNPKDLVELIIGDDKSEKFEVQQKIQRWDNEVNISFRLVHDEKNPVVSKVGEKIKWIGDKVEAHFYDVPIDENNPEGGQEFEVILKEKPATNVIEFTLEDKDVDYFYQPALTQEEIDEGAKRPENVVGSYAVYAKTPKTNWTGGKEYKVGKVGHIFRPKIIDSAGTEVWGDLHIENGILSVTIPQDFLDNAVYPVRHATGLTFGYTTKGSVSWGHLADNVSDQSQLYGMAFTLGVEGNITQISIALKNDVVNEALDLFFAVFREDSAGADSHDKVASAESLNVTVLNTSIEWYNLNFSSELLIADDYILAGLGNGEDLTTANNSCYLQSDNIGGTNRYYNENTTGAGSYAIRKAENPWTETDSTTTYKFSIYATYTAAGGAIPNKIYQINQAVNRANNY